MSIKLNKKGFTLIEVVLVLAIGGLIFLLAFLAFQQVSVNRRDTQRRSDAGRVVAELQNYYSDKKTYPAASVAVTDPCAGTPAAASFHEFVKNYLCKGTEFKSPSNTNYEVVVSTTTFASGDKDKIKFAPNTNCAAGTSGVRVEFGLEKGVSVCRDDQ